MISTVMVACTRCTTTRSIISWKKIGVASASTCSVSAAITTSAEGAALAQEFGDEPAQAERLAGVRQRVLALEQDDWPSHSSSPWRGPRTGSPSWGARGSRTTTSVLSGVSLTPERMTHSPSRSTRIAGSAWPRRRKPLPRQANQLRGQIDLARNLDQMGRLHPFRPRRRELDQLHLGKVEPMESGDRRQAGNSRQDRLGRHHVHVVLLRLAGRRVKDCGSRVDGFKSRGKVMIEADADDPAPPTVPAVFLVFSAS